MSKFSDKVSAAIFDLEAAEDMIGGREKSDLDESEREEVKKQLDSATDFLRQAERSLGSEGEEE